MFWGHLWSSRQQAKKSSPCLVSVLLKLLPSWRCPSLPTPPSHVHAALLPGYQHYQQPRWWETAQTRLSNSTTDLSQSPLKAISSAFQYGFEKAQDGSGAVHENHGSYTSGAYAPCSGAQWEFHRGLLTEVSTKPSVTQLIGLLLHGGTCHGQWVSGKLRRPLSYQHYLTLGDWYSFVLDNNLKLHIIIPSKQMNVDETENQLWRDVFFPKCRIQKGSFYKWYVVVSYRMHPSFLMMTCKKIRRANTSTIRVPNKQKKV